MELGINYTIKSIFGYDKIVWEIGNFLTSTSKKEWIIQSPEFSVEGPLLTKWRLFMKAKHVKEHYLVHIFLERLPCDSFSGTVQVNWKICYPQGNGKLISKQNRKDFEINTACGTKIDDTDVMGSKGNYLNANTFEVQCFMFVYIVNNKKLLESSKDSGLKSLSEDMTVLFTLRRGSDMQLKIGRREICHTHKAILCSRNNMLKTLIEKKDNSVVQLDFPSVNLETIEKVIGYLYTGNLKYILRTPSFSVEKMIDIFNISILKQYFLPDEWTLRTNCDVFEFSATWVIDKDMRKKDFIVSPHFTIDSRNVTFQILFYPNGIDGKKKFMSIFLQFLEGSVPEDLCLKFAIKDIQDSHTVKSLQWSPECGRQQGFENFASTDILQDLFYITEEKLRIFCKLKIPTGSSTHSVTCNLKRSPILVKKDEHYELLSKELSCLFQSGKYSDYTVGCGVFRFSAHKMILSFRSRVLEGMIKNENDKTFINLSSVDPLILRKVLNYLYSGTVEESTTDEILHMYDKAGTWTILPMRYLCSRILNERMKTGNVLRFLIAARKYKDSKLKTSAYKFIYDNVKDPLFKLCWEKLVEETPDIGIEFSKFERTFNHPIMP